MIILKLIVIVILTLISIKDIKTKTISDKSIFLLLIIGCFFPNFSERLIPMAVTFIFTLLLSLYKDNMGGGDVKLITAMSFFVGFKNTLYILLTALISCLIFGKITKQKEVAFAPFLSVWFFIILF